MNRAERADLLARICRVEPLEPRLLLTATIAINASSNVHAINPLIYGSAYASTAQIQDLRLTANRDGGNASDTYNWQLDATNHGSDWYYESIGNGTPPVPGASKDNFITTTKAGGAAAMMTVNILPYAAMPGANGAYIGSYPVTVYGPQQQADGNNGNGVTTAGAKILDTNPLLNYVTNSASGATTVTQQAWVQHLITKFGNSTSGGVQYYVMGNEPTLWNSTHRDIHPNGETLAELLNDYTSYGAMIKTLDPNAKIVGPEEWGWTGYMWDGATAAAGAWSTTYTGIHGEALNAEQWLLQQLQQYQTTNGVRLLDYFTNHIYPQYGGVFGNAVDTTTATKRNEMTRDFWDPNYVDPTWINTQIQLIPRMQGWVNTYYPGTKVGITEYNWGAEGDMNGATAQADIYGIFGSQNLDLGTRWTTPNTGTPTYLAMKLWRNYDSLGSGFGETSVGATVANQDLTDSFASIRASDGALTVAVINKTLYSAGSPTTSVTVNLSNFATNGVAGSWQLAAINPANQTVASITQLSNVNVVGGSFTVNVPDESVTMFVIQPASARPAPTGLTATAGNAQVILNWDAYTGATSYNIYRSTSAGGEGATPYQTGVATNTFTNTGLTNGTTYYYKVSAITTAGESPLSNEKSALPAIPPIAPTLSGSPSDRHAMLSWNAITGATSYNIYRGTVSGSLSLLQSAISTTSYTDSGLTNGTPYYYQVTAVNTGGESVRSNQLAITPQVSIPAPWVAADVGAPALGGYSSYAASTFTMTGSGSDIWNNADQFQFVYQPITGDATIVARVASQTNPDGWAKAGVMIRQDLTGGSPNACMVLDPNGSAQVQSRTTAGGASTSTAVTGINVPNWVKLVRVGNTFTGFYSSDGATWLPAAGLSATVTMTGTVYIGLCVSSHNTGLLSTATFTNVTVTNTQLPVAPTLSSATAGNGQVALVWTAVTGATSYKIYRGTTAGGESATPIQTGVTTTTFTNTGLTNGTTYYYKVTAVNGFGEGPQSNEKSAIPDIAPTVATASAAVLNAAGTTATLSVLGADDGGEPALTYAWTWTGPTGVTFSANNSNAAKNSVATFTQTGSYTFRATITDAFAMSVTSDVVVNVTQVLTSITLAPASPTIQVNTTQQFTATAKDQFAVALTVQPSFTWSVTSGSGTVSTAGLFTAPAVTGTSVVRAASGAVSQTVGVTVIPALSTALAGNAQVTLVWSAIPGATSYNVYRATTAGGEGATPYQTGITTATFTNTGLTNGTTYYYKVTAVNGFGEGAPSNEMSGMPQAAPAALTTNLLARDPSGGGPTMYQFQVQFTDATGIVGASLTAASTVWVTGPGGFGQGATFVSVDQPGNGVTRTGTYQITVNGGQTWSPNEEGLFTVSLAGGVVADTSGARAAGGVIGHFFYSYNPLFSERYYMTEYPDAYNAIIAGQFTSGYQHYELYGKAEGRNPSSIFNEAFYLKQYPLVAAAVAAGEFKSGFDHFVQYGAVAEYQPSLLFNQQWYLMKYPEVTAAIQAGVFTSALQHFMVSGQYEGYNPSMYFDTAYYVSHNADVTAAVTNGQIVSAFAHFLDYGMKEGRNAINVFDENYYLVHNPDVAAAVSAHVFLSGYAHYITNGQFEVARVPSTQFSTEYYLATYPDVAAAVTAGEFSSAFFHYLWSGCAEGRLGHA